MSAAAGGAQGASGGAGEAPALAVCESAGRRCFGREASPAACLDRAGTILSSEGDFADPLLNMLLGRASQARWQS